MCGTYAWATMAAAILLANALSEAKVEVTLTPVGGVYGMYNRPIPAAGQTPQPIELRLQVKSDAAQSQRIPIKLTAVDVFDGPVAWKQDRMLDTPGAGRSVEEKVFFAAGIGCFRIQAEAGEGAEKTAATTEVGIIPPFHPGVRPDSFFASNTSSLRRGEELKLLQAIGMKVQRAHFQPRLAGRVPPEPAGKPLDLDFKAQDEAWADSNAHGLWALPIVGYSFEGANSAAGQQFKMHGPPRDFAEFVSTWERLLRHYPQITTYEFWNEPWIFGWTWAATPAEYRRLQKAWCDMALKVNPKYRILAGNSSMFAEDHIEHDPACWKGALSGTTHHPYSYSTGMPNHRAGDVARSLDSGMQVTRRMGLPCYYITEGGSEWPDNGKNNLQNASKIVQYFVRTALIGAFQGNMQWGIGYGPAWTRSNTAFAVLSHFLEDRPVVADIWPNHELIFGAIFANPRFVTDDVRLLPRAQELGARWDVTVPPSRGDDPTRVAVIWSLTGRSNQKLDEKGRLTIVDFGDLKAYDFMGQKIPPVTGGKLVVPFTQYPVYITSEKLSVVELRARIGLAIIEQVTPVNMYALSLTEPADRPQQLLVRIENQVNRDVRGKLRLSIAGLRQETTAAFAAPAGKLVEARIPWPGAKLSEANQYGITLAAEVQTTDAVARTLGVVKTDQIIAVARFVSRTITVDGSLDDWQGVTPVLLDSLQVSKGFDPTAYLLNPNLPRPAQIAADRVVARVYTAYDDKNVYIAAAVNEPRLSCSAGQLSRPGLPYRKGMPDGLDHISLCGDVLLIAFGFRDRVPNWGRQMNDPYAWKGHFYDTDYQYAAHVSTDGDMLIRQWGDSTPRRTAYQTEAVPAVGPVPGSAISIRRDEASKLTIYEIAIPRTELRLFDPLTAERLRFGFVLANDERQGFNGLNWGEAAGVFDHWASAGSYGPSWIARVPCQTFFGFGK